MWSAGLNGVEKSRCCGSSNMEDIACKRSFLLELWEQKPNERVRCG